MISQFQTLNLITSALNDNLEVEDRIEEVTLNTAQRNKEVETVKDWLRDMETLRMKSNKSLKWVPKMRVEWIGDRNIEEMTENFQNWENILYHDIKKSTVNSGRNLQ